VAPSIRKFGNHFVDKRRLLGRHSSLADSDHGIFFFTVFAYQNNKKAETKDEFSSTLQSEGVEFLKYPCIYARLLGRHSTRTFFEFVRDLLIQNHEHEMFHVSSQSQSQSHIATDGQSVCLGVKPKSETTDQRFFFSKLLSCLFGAPSLTRGLVCHVSLFVIEVYHSLIYLQQYLHLN
jgi:hypothetical protein